MWSESGPNILLLVFINKTTSVHTSVLLLLLFLC